MDPVTIIVMALAAGAAAGLKPTAEAAIKDAYNGMKTLIQRRYGHVNVEMLEDDPSSKPRQEVVKEDLEKTDAGQDEEVLRQAKLVLDTVKSRDPQAAGAVGVDLEDIEGAALRIEDIIASGTGVKLRRGKMAGDIDIKQVRAGSGEDIPKV